MAFSGGLGVAGLHPVFAVYSTFLQRTYDQVFHDVALQRARTVLAIDRAGLVGGDGVTHQGIYDVSMLSSIPGISIYSPDSFAELRESLDEAVSLDALTAVRYPRGGEPEYDRSAYHAICGDAAVAADYGVAPRLTVITYGRITAEASHAAEALSARGTAVRIIRLKKNISCRRTGAAARAARRGALSARGGYRERRRGREACSRAVDCAVGARRTCTENGRSRGA